MAINNSIRAQLSKDDLLAEIRMQLSSPLNEHKTFLVFEGLDDIYLFESLVNTDECFLYESYGGKESLREIVENHFLDKRIIAIRDKDYDTKSDCERIFYCDYCNAEMMMVSNDLCFSRFMRKMVRKNEDFTALREQVLDALKVISFTRKQNDEKSWGIDLSNISVEYMFSLSNPISLKNLVLHINSKSVIKFDDTMQSTVVDELNNNTNSLLHYTNGHDFCVGLKCIVNNLFGINKNAINKFNLADFRSMLSLPYNLDFFKTTNLYASLKKYEEKSELHIVVV